MCVTYLNAQMESASMVYFFALLLFNTNTSFSLAALCDLPFGLQQAILILRKLAPPLLKFRVGICGGPAVAVFVVGCVCVFVHSS